jgi:hypothetical protein
MTDPSGCAKTLALPVPGRQVIHVLRRGRAGSYIRCAYLFRSLRARIAAKLLALAAGVWLDHYLGRPTRSFAALAA